MTAKKDFTPQPIFTIEDVDTLRVVADPMRLQIMELLTGEALTVKQVGDRLGLAASKLYYHMKMLEKHGLVTLVETRMVANLQEKYFRATADQIALAEELLQLSPDGVLDPISSVIASTLDATREDVMRSLQAHNFQLEQDKDTKRQSAMITRHIMQLDPDQVKAFTERLQALVGEFTAVAPQKSHPDLRTWAMTIAFYPSIHFPDEEE